MMDSITGHNVLVLLEAQPMLAGQHSPTKDDYLQLLSEKEMINY